MIKMLHGDSIRWFCCGKDLRYASDGTDEEWSIIALS